MVGATTNGHGTSPRPSRTSDRFFSPGFFCFRGLALPPSLPTILVNNSSKGSSRGLGEGGEGGSGVCRWNSQWKRDE